MIVGDKHKHTIKRKYIQEVIIKTGVKRWLVIEYCTECKYSKAVDMTYDEPPQEPTEPTELDN
jgi:hypothetical protein